jgi:cytochrome c-type biogenesis protein CcmH/NrfG
MKEKGMDTTPKAGTKWTGKQAYVLAVVCMLVGIPVGYMLRVPSGTASTAVQNVPRSAPGPVSLAAEVSPEQLKHMADVQAKPLLAQLEKNPKDAALLAEAGKTYFYAHQFEISAQYYERSAKIKPDAEVLTTLGNTYHYAGADDRAIDAFNRALAIDPKFANALFNLGMLQWQVKNDPKRAVEAWQRLLKTNPNHPRRAQVEEMIAKARLHMEMPAGMKIESPPR